MQILRFLATALTTSVLIFAGSVYAEHPMADHLGHHAQPGPVTVNTDNYVRAETAFQFERFLKLSGGINKWAHNRVPTPIDKQNVIRMNRDTLYSFAIVDVSEGATVTMPDSGKRYMTLMVVDENMYINQVFHKAGTYDLSVDKSGSKYVLLAGRTLADSSDPADIKKANALQDGLKIEARSSKPYSPPDYDKKSYQATYKPLLALSALIPDTKRMFGKKEEVDETRHMLGAAFGWGGLPIYEAFYITKNTPRHAGDYTLTVKDVPVKGFWSISIYNKDGYFQKNKYDSYSINNVMAKPNKDGSVTVNFGTEKGDKENFLYVMDGWNYAVRLYEPSKEIQDGKWTFPEPQAVK